MSGEDQDVGGVAGGMPLDEARREADTNDIETDIDTNGGWRFRERGDSGWDPDLAGSEPESVIETSPDAATNRATGRAGVDPFDAPDEFGAFGDSSPSFSLFGRRESTYSLFDKPIPELMHDSDSGAPAAGERVLDWTKARDMKEGNPIELVVDFVRGLVDFATSYHEMGKINTRGADNYYHCYANCTSASLGPGGIVASHTASWAREVIWAPKTLRNTGSISAAWDDILSDNRQNQIGRQEGQRIWYEGHGAGTRCRDTCLELVPPSSRRFIQ